MRIIYKLYANALFVFHSHIIRVLIRVFLFFYNFRF
jgi:hypothetical protein